VVFAFTARGAGFVEIYRLVVALGTGVSQVPGADPERKEKNLSIPAAAGSLL